MKNKLRKFILLAVVQLFLLSSVYPYLFTSGKPALTLFGIGLFTVNLIAICAW